ncbi:hypothetical protein BDY21DRAFT_1736 [Lineolata rhizophorae]|uniref:Homeobox domain-containing protein n=1 Tax=Lineolata rhizophorae TaxID=578093 RepID=A0A6A6PCY2_9PEZI|nr:hypothetical protein BDY21DRAFT_1736 [Lineolata rhizophorae]
MPRPPAEPENIIARALAASATKALSKLPRAATKPKRKVNKFPAATTEILTNWLNENHDDPYPTKATVTRLAKDTELKEKQVRTWLTNHRKRQLDPMEKFLSSDEECASEEDIVRNSQSPEYSNSSGFNSVSSSKSISPAGSAYSYTHLGDRIRKRRKGVKAYRSKPLNLSAVDQKLGDLGGSSNSEANSPSPSDSKMMFECTFCCKKVSPKGWKRHEETQHQPSHEWVCMTTSARLSLPSSADTECAFCQMLNPDEEHFRNEHRISDCLARPQDERVFTRKDHLAQHLAQFHDCKVLHQRTAAAWKSKIDYGSREWHCGFCGVLLDNWDSRASHISSHFRKGKTMADWDTNRAPSSGQLPANASGFCTTRAPTPNPSSTSPNGSFNSDVSGLLSNANLALAKDISQLNQPTFNSVSEINDAVARDRLRAKQVSIGVPTLQIPRQRSSSRGSSHLEVAAAQSLHRRRRSQPEMHSGSFDNNSLSPAHAHLGSPLSARCAYSANNSAASSPISGPLRGRGFSLGMPAYINVARPLRFKCIEPYCEAARFQTIPEWRAHQATHSSQIATWKCQWATPSGSGKILCGEFFPSLQGFLHHLQTVHQVAGNDDWMAACASACCITGDTAAPAGAAAQMWCGFCLRMMPLASDGTGFDRKLDHILEHLTSGLSMENWQDVTKSQISIPLP